MFGSNFAANFGLPDFGYQGADPQGGYFAPNAPPAAGQNPSQNAAPSGGQLNLGTPSPGIAQSPIAAASPLAGGPLAPGGGQPPQQPNANPEAAPAAGVGSPFGKA